MLSFGRKSFIVKKNKASFLITDDNGLWTKNLKSNFTVYQRFPKFIFASLSLGPKTTKKSTVLTAYSETSRFFVIY